MLKTSYSHPDLVASKSSQQGRSGQQRAGLGLCAAFFCSCSQVLDKPTDVLPFLKLLSAAFFHLLPLCPCYSFIIISFRGIHVISRFLYYLQGLKKNWEEVHKEFQSLSVFIDSIPKKIRKQKLEEEMKQLEHDISVIEKHKIIYIANK